VSAPRAPYNARVLMVSVGAVADLPYRDRSVRSAIVKTPVEGLVAATELGLHGDEQGDARSTAAPTRRSASSPPSTRRTTRSSSAGGWSARRSARTSRPGG
jgi:hypothetical protein